MAHLVRFEDAQRGLTLGVVTGLAVALIDIAWTSLGRFGVSLPQVLAIVGLVVPVAALAGVVLATYSGTVGRALPAERGRAARLLASALVAVPFLAFALWVPASWIDEAWQALRFNGRAAVVAALAGIAVFVLLACMLVRALVRRHAEGRLSTPVLGALAAAAALVAAASYWVDGTLFEGDYEDFHYGASGAFVAATALTLAAARALLPTLGLTARRRVPPGARRAGLVLLGMAPLAVAAAPPGALGRSGALVFEKLIGTARGLTDVDGDGYSSLFGGADCAAFDSHVSPERQEIPGNARDEDCTGKDAAWPVAPPQAGGSAAANRWNVVLIVVDALRADHLGLYGYPRPTSPAIDRLGSESLVFEEAYSQAPKTSESMPSFMTGTYPSNVPRDYENVRHKRKWVFRLHKRAVPLAVLMKRAGYTTGAGVGFKLLRIVGLDRGFDSFLWRPADAVAAQFLGSTKPPFFYWAHFKQPHAPYEKNPAHDFGDSDLDRYDGEVRAADESVRRVVESLRARNLLDSTVVIVTADHGEEFGEHGGHFHARKLYRELLHVPLIIRVPGLPARRIAEPVELVDIVPTLADLIGFELPPGVQDGQSLLKWPRAREVGGAYAEDVDERRRVVGRAFFDGRYRLVDDLRRGRRELFDDRSDRAEQRDIKTEQGEIARQLWETMSVRSLRRHTKTFELLKPDADPETWARLLPTLERDEMLDLALERLPREATPARRAILKRLLARVELEPALAVKAKKLLAAD
jgi:arylsulfatase A-like enzyme